MSVILMGLGFLKCSDDNIDIHVHRQQIYCFGKHSNKKTVFFQLFSEKGGGVSLILNFPEQTKLNLMCRVYGPAICWPDMCWVYGARYMLSCKPTINAMWNSLIFDTTASLFDNAALIFAPDSRGDLNCRLGMTTTCFLLLFKTHFTLILEKFTC